jgi:hypothetical protein
MNQNPTKNKEGRRVWWNDHAVKNSEAENHVSRHKIQERNALEKKSEEKVPKRRCWSFNWKPLQLWLVLQSDAKNKIKSQNKKRRAKSLIAKYKRPSRRKEKKEKEDQKHDPPTKHLLQKSPKPKQKRIKI